MFKLLESILSGEENKEIRRQTINRILAFSDDADLKNVVRVSRASNVVASQVLFVRSKIRALLAVCGFAASAFLVERIIESLLQAFEFKKNDTIKVDNVPGSNSPWSTVLKIAVNDQTYILRLIDLNKGINDVREEVKIFKKMADIGISPKLWYGHQSDGVLLMDYINVVPGWQAKLTAQDLQALAQQIKLMHQIGKFSQNNFVAKNGLLMQRRESFVKALSKHPVFYLHSSLLPILDKLDQFIEEKCFAHNDLHPSNILKDENQFFIIDVENAGLGDGDLDISLFAAACRLNPQQEQIFFEAYYGQKLDPKQKAKIYIMKIIALMRLAISFFASCNDYKQPLELSVSDIPDFNSYQKSDGAVDMSTDKGKFYVSTMLIKQALKYLTSEEYLKHIQLLAADNHTQNLWSNPVHMQNNFINRTEKGILSFLTDADLVELGSINKLWQQRTKTMLIGRQRSIACEQKIDAALTLLKNFDQERVKKAIQSAFVVDLKHDLDLQPIDGGLSPWANLYSLKINGTKYVLRLLEHPQDNASYVRELHCLNIYSFVGIAPPIEYFDFEKGVVIMKHVEHNAKWMANVNTDVLIDLARLLKLIHKMEFSATKKTVFSANNKFSQLIAKLKSPVVAGRFEFIRPTLAAYAELESALEKMPHVKANLCHYDLNPWNILHDGAKFWAIDWEFSRTGNKLFDIATIANFLRLDAQKEEFLLTSYFGGKITPQQKAEYYLIKQFCYLRYALCSFALCENFGFELPDLELEKLPSFQNFKPKIFPSFTIDKNTDIGKFMIGIMFARQALENMQTQEFKAALELNNLDVKLLNKVAGLRLGYS